MAKNRNRSKPVSPKNINVTEDTQIHLTTVYGRNRRTAPTAQREKRGAKRAFSFVIKGLLISSALVGSIIGSGGQAFAAEAPAAPTHDLTVSKVVQADSVRDDAVLISNLKMANKMVDAAIAKGQLSVSIYDNVMKRLSAIDARVVADGGFNSTSELLPVLQDTDIVLKATVNKDTSIDVLAARQSTIDTLEQLQDHLGVEHRGADTLMTDKYTNTVSVKPLMAAKTLGASPGTLVGASSGISKNGIKVTINGQLQNYAQPPVSINGSTLVPMRDIFQSLGASINWDAKTQTITAIKDNKVIQITLGKSTATINGKQVSLSTKAVSINGATMVPLRFVSEALGAGVKWDAATNTVKIESSGAVVTTPVYNGGNTSNSGSSTPTTGHVSQSGIKVRYGNHDYGSRNQSEYDQTMKIIDKAMQGIENRPVGNSESYAANEAWFQGKTWKDYDPKSLDYGYMQLAELRFDPLVSAGASKSEIKKIVQGVELAVQLYSKASISNDASPRSAYDALVRGVRDCDPEAQIMSAVLDSLGYDTAIIAGDNHAAAIVRVNNTWIDLNSGDTSGYNLTKALNSHGNYVMAQPTNGSF